MVEYLFSNENVDYKAKYLLSKAILRIKKMKS